MESSDSPTAPLAADTDARPASDAAQASMVQDGADPTVTAEADSPPNDVLSAADGGEASEPDYWAEEEADEDEAGDPAAPPAVTFADLGLSEPIVRAVAESGYVTPTPIQEAAIPVVLQGRDVLGCAQTGTGKTAGFTLPMLDILSNGRAKARMPRSLILEPTRELALQVAENFVKYGRHLNLVHALLIGGESMNDQRAVLERGVDVLIATPGRLLDLFERGRILLADCRVLVIDEADRMLDMGFIPDVERIVSMLPPMRQTLFFSATMAPEIRRLADAFLSNPREITVSAPATVATTITAGLAFVREGDKREALRRLLRAEAVQNALIFCNRKVEVDILYKSLKRHGFSVGALHGDMDQPTRFATLNKFKSGELQLLVCSDVAARGLDIGGLSHVFNFDVPFHAEDYVHRIGRTGRAGREGAAFTLAVADDARNVAAIETLTGRPIPRIVVDGLEPVTAEEIEAAAKRPRSGRGRGGPPRGREGTRREEGRRDGGRREGGRRDEPRREARPEVGAAAEDRPRRDDDRAPRREPDDRAPRRDDQPRDARRRDDRAPREAARDTEVRLPRDTWRERDAPRRRDRDRDDLGPPVQGFGDSVPAFMLIQLPRPRRDLPADSEGEGVPEQEAA